MEEAKQQYKIKVGGEYSFGPRNSVQMKAYEATFVLTEKDGEALSTIQNRLITPELRKMAPDLRHVRTCRILSQKPVDGEKPRLKAADLPKMTLDELALFAAEGKLKTDPNNFGSIEEARREIQKELDDAVMAKKVKAKKGSAAKKDKQAPIDQDAPTEEDEFADDN